MDKILLDGKQIIFKNNLYYSEKSFDYLKKCLAANDGRTLSFFNNINNPTEKAISLINKNMKSKVFLEYYFADYFPYFHKKLGEIPQQLAVELVFLSICSTNENLLIVVSDKDFQSISGETIRRYNEKCLFVIYNESNSSHKSSHVVDNKTTPTSVSLKPRRQLLDYLFLSLLLLAAMVSGVLTGSFFPPQRLNNIAEFIQNVHNENDSSFEVIQYNVVKAKDWAENMYPVMTDSILKMEKDFLQDEAITFVCFQSAETFSPVNVDFFDYPDQSVSYNFIGVSSREYLGLTLLAASNHDYIFTNEVSIPQSYADFMIQSLGFSIGDYSSLIGQSIENRSQYNAMYSEETLIVNSVIEENPLYLSYQKIIGDNFFMGSLTKYYPSLPKIDIQINDLSTENIRRIFNYIEKYLVIEKDFLLSYALFSYTISLLEEASTTYTLGENNTTLAAIDAFYNSSNQITYLLFFSISFLLCNYLAFTTLSKMVKRIKRPVFLPLPLICLFGCVVFSMQFINSITIFDAPIYISNFYGNFLILLDFLFLLFWTLFIIKNSKKVRS